MATSKKAAPKKSSKPSSKKSTKDRNHQYWEKRKAKVNARRRKKRREEAKAKKLQEKQRKAQTTSPSATAPHSEPDVAKLVGQTEPGTDTANDNRGTHTVVQVNAAVSTDFLIQEQLAKITDKDVRARLGVLIDQQNHDSAFRGRERGFEAMRREYQEKIVSGFIAEFEQAPRDVSTTWNICETTVAELVGALRHVGWSRHGLGARRAMRDHMSENNAVSQAA